MKLIPLALTIVFGLITGVMMKEVSYAEASSMYKTAAAFSGIGTICSFIALIAILLEL